MRPFVGTLILETPDFERRRVAITEAYCRYHGDHPNLKNHPGSWTPVAEANRVIGIDRDGGIWLLKDRTGTVETPYRLATPTGYDL